MSQDSLFHATTILAVKKDGHTAVAGDGQVTMGNAVIMKNTALCGRYSDRKSVV